MSEHEAKVIGCFGRYEETRRNADPAKTKAKNSALCRVRIEHVFAKLKTWRIIHHFYPMRPETYAQTVKAIAFIHNLTIRDL